MGDASSYQTYKVKFGDLIDDKETIKFSFTGNNGDPTNKKFVAGECKFDLVDRETGIGRQKTWVWSVALKNDNLNAVSSGVVKTKSGAKINQGFLWESILGSRQKTIGNLTLQSPDMTDNSDVSNVVSNVVYMVGDASSKVYNGRLYVYS
jgi:hypothetical protein